VPGPEAHGAKVMQRAGGIRAMRDSEAPYFGVQEGISPWCKYQTELRLVHTDLP